MVKRSEVGDLGHAPKAASPFGISHRSEGLEASPRARSKGSWSGQWPGKGRDAIEQENIAHMRQLPQRGVVLGVVRLQRHRHPKRVLSLAQLATALRLEATLAVVTRLVARAPAARPRAVPPHPLLEEGCPWRVSQPRVPVGQRLAKGCIAAAARPSAPASPHAARGRAAAASPSAARGSSTSAAALSCSYSDGALHCARLDACSSR